jgi:nucleoside phosphorylase
MFDVLSTFIAKVNAFKTEIEELNFASKKVFSEVTNSFHNCDIIILSSTQQEFDSIFNILEEPLIIKIENDSSIYYKGYIKGYSTDYSIVVPVPTDMGIATAAIITTKCISIFKPKYIIMSGIAAGIKSICKIGDVIIGDKAINYNEVVEIENPDSTVRLKYMQNTISISSHLKSRLYLFLKSSDANKISNHELLKQLSRKISFHFGMIVTGSGLIRNNQRITQLTSDYHNIKGLDMETYGMYKAVEQSLKTNQPEFISIKSVSDFGDSKKHAELESSEDRSRLALFTSSKTIELFIKSEYFEK